MDPPESQETKMFFPFETGAAEIKVSLSPFSLGAVSM